MIIKSRLTVVWAYSTVAFWASPSADKPLEALEVETFLSSFWRLFHILAASKGKDFCPYATVRTVGICSVF